MVAFNSSKRSLHLGNLAVSRPCIAQSAVVPTVTTGESPLISTISTSKGCNMRYSSRALPKFQQQAVDIFRLCELGSPGRSHAPLGRWWMPRNTGPGRRSRQGAGQKPSHPASDPRLWQSMSTMNSDSGHRNSRRNRRCPHPRNGGRTSRWSSGGASDAGEGDTRPPYRSLLQCSGLPFHLKP